MAWARGKGEVWPGHEARERCGLGTRKGGGVAWARGKGEVWPGHEARERCGLGTRQGRGVAWARGKGEVWPGHKARGRCGLGTRQGGGVAWARGKGEVWPGHEANHYLLLEINSRFHYISWMFQMERRQGRVLNSTEFYAKAAAVQARYSLIPVNMKCGRSLE